MGPPLNKRSFPVDRPGGIILQLKLKYFSHFSSDFQTVFTSVYRMIRRLHKGGLGSKVSSEVCMPKQMETNV